MMEAIKLAGEIIDLDVEADENLANDGRMKHTQEMWEQCRLWGVELAQLVVNLGSANDKQAFVEYLLQIKTFRERAETATKEVERLMRELGAEAKEKLKAQRQVERQKSKVEKKKAEIKELKFDVKVYSDAEAGRRDENGRAATEVISYIDDCGHTVIVDCTGPAQKLKIYRQLLRSAQKQGCTPETSEHYDVDKLLESGTVEQIQECIYDSDICLGGRDGLDPHGVCTDWPDEELSG